MYAHNRVVIGVNFQPDCMNQRLILTHAAVKMWMWLPKGKNPGGGNVIKTDEQTES